MILVQLKSTSSCYGTGHQIRKCFPLSKFNAVSLYSVVHSLSTVKPKGMSLTPIYLHPIYVQSSNNNIQFVKSMLCLLLLTQGTAYFVRETLQSNGSHGKVKGRSEV